MTTQQVAELLGVSADTVYRLKEKPDGLRAYRVGHSLRFRRDEVETYLACHVVEPIPAASRRASGSSMYRE